MDALLFCLVLAVASSLPASHGDPPGDLDTCLACHADRSLTRTLPSGEVQPLSVDRAQFLGSVHGKRLNCADCHVAMTEVPHPESKARSRRQFRLAAYDACKRCHFSNFTKTLDSVHFAPLARGDTTAPVCVDCHGSHDMQPPGKPRSHISTTCASCHQGVAAQYRTSVHGKALLEQGNADSPVCTDCHQSHSVAGPKDKGWLARSPEVCAKCHDDEKLMKKYGLSTKVNSTYLADFHGMTASLKASQGGQQVFTALCVDCHGVHDIRKASGEGAPAMRANLVRTCQRCHAGASANFPAAWLSHYEPSLKHAPLVYAVTVAYWFLIPFMIGGLVLQILLHVWRVVVNR